METLNPTAELAPLGKYFKQLGYVVEDPKATIAFFEKLGATGFKRMTAGGDIYQTASGESRTAPRLDLAFGMLGPIEIEVIKPLSEGNFYADFLAQRGPGLHHTAYDFPTYGEYRAAYLRMLDAGGVQISGRRIESAQFNIEFAYFDCSAFGGATIELTHYF